MTRVELLANVKRLSIELVRLAIWSALIRRADAEMSCDQLLKYVLAIPYEYDRHGALIEYYIDVENFNKIVDRARCEGIEPRFTTYSKFLDCISFSRGEHIVLTLCRDVELPATLQRVAYFNLDGAQDVGLDVDVKRLDHVHDVKADLISYTIYSTEMITLYYALKDVTVRGAKADLIRMYITKDGLDRLIRIARSVLMECSDSSCSIYVSGNLVLKLDQADDEMYEIRYVDVDMLRHLGAELHFIRL